MSAEDNLKKMNIQLPEPPTLWVPMWQVKFLEI